MNMQVAKEILNQLGGNKFIAMTGAKNFVSASNSISFTIGRNASKANRCVVTLNEGSDLYTVEFWNVASRTAKISVLHSYTGVFNENLPDVFTAYTGLQTKL